MIVTDILQFMWSGTAIPMNRLHETLGVLHIVELAPLLWFAEGALQLKANLLAIETALLTRRQQSADHKDKVCQVGVTVNTEHE